MALKSLVASPLFFSADAAVCTGLPVACIEFGKEVTGFATGTTGGAAAAADAAAA
eukprot:CAMPEP_0172681446 /NCGR_PEP_ID=MMETSP1074-20121228/17460_1 /TAXON_ID=2916 /ORGANISM="Ceratium fusus, Strain PA161109" /LENGTH=54 /DNA_ID=CAMNT_0013499953 /DNA_START=379 /DNA_END=540 /DNA_ORIENTATION=-